MREERKKFSDCICGAILSPEAFEANHTREALEACNHSSIFDKAVLSLGEKQGMLVNDECS